MHKASADAGKSETAVGALRCMYDSIVRFSDVYRNIWKQYSHASHSNEGADDRHDRLIEQLTQGTNEICGRFGCGFCESLPRFLAESVLGTAMSSGVDFDRMIPIYERLTQPV